MPEFLVVDQEHLKNLAAHQETAAEEAATAAGVVEKEKVPLTPLGIWLTHGVYSAESNIALNLLVDARRAAAQTMKEASIELAARVVAAGVTYEGVDEDLSANINKQVLDR